MKTVIAIFASAKPPYPDLIQAAKETWASVKNRNVRIVFFWGGEKEYTETYSEVENVIGYCTGTSDEYDMQHIKYKKFLQYIWEWEWDYVLRGSLSSYFDVNLVDKKAYTLPKEKCYFGIDGGGFASGCGHFQSRDVAEIIKNETPDYCPIAYEDAFTGEMLRKHGINVSAGAERQDFSTVEDPILDMYHYRCKVDINDRKKDIEIFKRIHKFKQSSQCIS